MLRFILAIFMMCLLSCSSIDKKEPQQTVQPVEQIKVEEKTQPVEEIKEEIKEEVKIEIIDPCKENPCKEKNRNICKSDKESFNCECNEGFEFIGGICTDKKILVLSVGAERGLAHIGAIKAFNEAGINFDAVFGNSMGSLIGSLYAVSPKQDISSRYIKLMNDLVPLKWYNFWIPAFFGIKNKELMEYLKALNNEIKIEEMVKPFATSFFKIKDGHINLYIAQSGDLASAVGGSVNNPIIFDEKMDKIENLDPGFDRLSSIPVEDACKLFGPALIYAVNVTEDEIMYTSKMNCKVIEIKISPINDINQKNAIIGKEPDFNKIVDKGYNEVKKILKKK